MKRFLLWSVLCLACGALGAGAALVLVAPRFPSSTVIAGVPVGGLTRDQAEAELHRHWDDRLRETIEISVPDADAPPVVYSPYEIGLRVDAAATLDAALRRVKMYRIPANRPGKTIPAESCLRWVVEDEMFAAFVERMSRYDRPRGRPRIRFADGAVSLVHGEPGRAFDAVEALQRVQRAVLVGGRSIEAPFAPPEPNERDKALEGIRYELGSKTTSFRAGETSRSHNIKLAAQEIDGVVLLPGEVFSYNAVVGKRSAARGFRIAPIFANGRHVPGIGGGVCQVSSTTYNAALLAGLKIVERHNHQMVVGYVPVGLDATVDFGNKDLKFENNTGGPIALVSEYKPGRLTVRVLGSKPPNGLTYKLVVTNRSSSGYATKTIPNPSLAPGQQKVVEKGGAGFRCTAWRYVYDGDRLVRKDFLGHSRYIPSTRIVHVGPQRTVPSKPPHEPEPVSPVPVSSETAEPND